MEFRMPPVLENERGEVRNVGFELEFSGIELDRIVDTIREMFGGTPMQKSTFSYEVRDTRYGTFAVDLDAPRLKDKSYIEMLEKVGISLDHKKLLQNIEDALLKTASAVVPFEIGTPPIPLSELSAVDELRRVLCERDALGTRTSFFYAFGLHINPEVPSGDPGRLLNYLRAFLLLYDWICEEGKIDLARRLTPFINPFPEAYTRLVLNPAYRPDADAFVRDYLRHNPTRYRPLDLLALFLHLDERAIEGWDIDPGKISPRPTFHYRLPNCLIDDPDWRIAREWNDWVQVERLAEDEPRLREMCAVFLDETPGGFTQPGWAERVREWIA